jgi:hypothetical protein
MKSNGHAADCACIVCKGDEEPKVFGQWKSFRDFVDGMCDAFHPKNAYIYPKFACFEFEWASDRRKFVDYIEDGSADRYTGVHVDDDDDYWAVIIDVTGEVPNE